MQNEWHLARLGSALAKASLLVDFLMETNEKIMQSRWTMHFPEITQKKKNETSFATYHVTGFS